jgi:CubicO group peptidase (beta-lactamase class C family)
MRTAVHAAVAAMAMLFGSSATLAQDAPATAPLPKGPIPYTTLHPKPVAKPRPPAPKPAASPAATQAVAVHPVAPGTLPVAAGVPPLVAGAHLPAGQPIPPAELAAFVDGMVKDAMAREHIAGVTVSIVQNGQVVLKKGYGFASLTPQRPVDPDRSLFRVASISKTFTWIALMKEVEAGRIRLNQPINLYLPEKVQVKDQGYDQPVRVINLMDHSAGFEDRALGQLFERDFDRVRPLDLYLRQERPKRVHSPGAISSYSNYGAALAGLAAAYTSGKPYERLIEDDVLNPLGMSHTTFREPHPPKAGIPAAMSPALAADVAQPYHWMPWGFRQQPYEYVGQIAPAGAASTTAGDMARYMIAILDGGQLGGVSIYGPQTAQAFRTPIRKTPRGVNGWAHGFMTFDLPGGYRGYGHGGDTLDFHSNLVTVPALGLGVFISTNSATGAPLAGRFPDRIVQQFYGPPQIFPRPGSPELAQQSGVFEGYYLSTRRTYSGLEGFVTGLIGGTQVSVTPGGRLFTANMDGSHTWVPEGPLDQRLFIAADGDQRMAFTLEPDRAAAFLGSGGASLFQRQPFWRRPMVLALIAALTAAAAITTLIGIPLRNRREFRENGMQARGALVQNIQAGLWLAAIALFGLWASKSSDVAQIMYGWPGPLVVTASACALVAAVLTVVTLAALPAVWRGGRRVDSWSHLRKTFFSLTALIYAGFSLLLGAWGALSPWSG